MEGSVYEYGGHDIAEMVRMMGKGRQEAWSVERGERGKNPRGQERNVTCLCWYLQE